MERTALRHADLIDSVYMLCDGNSIEADAIINGPVSMYEAKLRHFVNVNKAEKENKQQFSNQAKKPVKK